MKKGFALFTKSLLLGAFFTGTVACLEDRTPSWVAAWGANRYGELGIGSNINSTKPMKLNMQFLDVSAKKSVSAGIGVDGRVYVWGKVWKGLLAEGVNTSCLLPTEIESLPPGRYKQVECSHTGLSVVSEEGDVYQWKNQNSSAGFRTIGTDNVSKQKTVGFTRVEGLTRIKELCCSVDHTLALSQSGQVYSWGKHEKRLGRKGDPKIPLLVTLPKIAQISAGSDCMLALDFEGKVYCWGNNNFGELGLPDTKMATTPQLLRTLEHENIKEISCGNNHVAAITKQGEVYTWGFGNEGQLGHGDKVDQHIPRKLDLTTPVSQVACGGGHTVFVTQSNGVYTTGRGRQGQLGRQEKDQGSHGFSLKPRLVQSISSHIIKKIVCGDYHTFVMLARELNS